MRPRRSLIDSYYWSKPMGLIKTPPRLPTSHWWRSRLDGSSLIFSFCYIFFSPRLLLFSIARGLVFFFFTIDPFCCQRLEPSPKAKGEKWIGIRKDPRRKKENPHTRTCTQQGDVRRPSRQRVTDIKFNVIYMPLNDFLLFSLSITFYIHFHPRRKKERPSK